MKISTRTLFLSAAVAFCLTLAFASFAQDNPPPAPAAVPAPAGKAPVVAAPAAPAATTPAPATETKPEQPDTGTPKLRRIDEPSTPRDSRAWRQSWRTRGHHDDGDEIVNFGGNSTLAKDHHADAVVAIFGSATSEGEVSDSVVSVFGNTRASGTVGDAAVAVFGKVYVNGRVGDAVVAVFGNVELGPDAEVNDVVAVGGQVIRDPKAIVHGQVNNVSFGGTFGDFGWLQSWITHCAFSFRLLAFAPGLMWAWWIALGFLALYVVLALLFGKGVIRCVDTLEQRPGYSILAALLTVLLAPVVTILLIFTGVGIAVVPFLGAAIFFATLFGKVVMFAWLGRRLARLAGSDHPALAVLFGGVIVLFLYTVPVVGLIVYKLLGWVGLGVVVYTLVSGLKREKPAVPPAVPPVAPPPAPGVPPAGDPAAASVPLAPAVVASPVPPVIPAVTLPRAGFWIRVAALLLDAILVAMICSLLSGIVRDSSHVHMKSDLLPSLAFYGALMWKLKGSTVGGIVCGLKVIRLDDRPLDWGTAIVRALACFLSLFVLGLGFLWVVFDDQRQSWHDKIAGTVVVRVPKGVSLV